MAQGTLTVFEEFAAQVGKKIHDFVNDTLKVGIVDATITPLAADASPTWADYSANEVSTAGGYVADGISLTGVTYTEVDGVATLKDTGNISLVKDTGGFTDGYWAIIYNSTSTGKEAIGFIELDGPISEAAGPVTITWGTAGIVTFTVE